MAASGYADARGRSSERPRPAFKRAGDPWGDAAGGGGDTSRAAAIVASVGPRWVDLLASVVRAGYGLTVSGTSDGGAVSLALLVDGQVHKRYAADPDALNGLIDVLAERLHATREGPGL